MHILYAVISLFLMSSTQVFKNSLNDQQSSKTVIATNEKQETESNVSNNSILKRRIILKGTINNTLKITMYINEQEHPCGGNSTVINAMYKYDEQGEWMLLNTTRDVKKQRYCMVEDNFTGVLFLEEHNNLFTGQWISPDTKKQYSIVLKNICNASDLECDETVIEKLDETLFDDLIYSKNDC